MQNCSIPLKTLNWSLFSVSSLLPCYNQQHTAMLTICCFYERFAFRNASCLTWGADGVSSLRNYLSRFREDPLRGNGCGHDTESPCHDFSKPWALFFHQLRGSADLRGAPPNRIGPPLWHLLRDSFMLCPQLLSRETASKQHTFVALLRVLLLHLITLLPVALVPEPADCCGCPSLLLRLVFEEPHQSLWHHWRLTS